MTSRVFASFFREHTNAECFISMITEAAQLCPGTIRRQRAGSEAYGPGELLADFAYSPTVWNSHVSPPTETHPEGQIQRVPISHSESVQMGCFLLWPVFIQKEKSTVKKFSDLSPTTGSFRLTSTGLLRVLSFHSGYSAPSGSLWGGRESTVCSRIAGLQQQAGNSAQKLGNKKVEV